jgi:hypothetical protein
MPDPTHTNWTGSSPIFADDLRPVWSIFTEGVVGATDYEVTAGVTGLSVDVDNGVAFVEGDSDPDQLTYRARLVDPLNSDSFTASGLAAADPSDPRLDVIVVHVYDDEWDASGNEGLELEVLEGTPTTGATLDNRNGAAAVPDTALWLADVLVPAGATSISSGDIRDKRVMSTTSGVVTNGLGYKGVLDCSANPNYPAADAGDLYVVSVAGKIGGASGTAVDIGDLALCKDDGTASGTQAGVGANWDVIQANLVGAVSGPASATNSDFAQFDGTTGKLIKDGGLALDTDGTMAANSDAKVASQKAIRTFIAANAGAGRKAIFDHFTNAGNVGSTLTTLYSDSVVANQLANNGDKLHFKYNLALGAHATHTRELVLTFDAAQIFDTGTFTTTDEQWNEIEGTIIRANTNTIRVVCHHHRGKWSDGSFVTSLVFAGTFGGTFDFTSALALVLKAQAGSGSANNEIVATMGVIEFEPKA